MTKEKIISWGLVVILSVVLILTITNIPEDNSDKFKKEIAKKEAQISDLRALYSKTKSEYYKNKKALENKQDSLKKAVSYYKEELNKVPEYYEELSDKEQVEVLEDNLDTSLYVDNDEMIQLPMNRASWINVEFAKVNKLEMVSRSQQDVIETQDSIIKRDSLFIAEQSNHIDTLSMVAQKSTELSKKINRAYEKEKKKNKRLKNITKIAGAIIIVETAILILQ